MMPLVVLFSGLWSNLKRFVYIFDDKNSLDLTSDWPPPRLDPRGRGSFSDKQTALIDRNISGGRKVIICGHEAPHLEDSSENF